jgi:FtsP/CotA-like multicopper oxidase with cupredoxin domain
MIIIKSNAQMAPFPVPHYFGPYPNFATSSLPIVTYNPDGSIASVSGGISKFVDGLPLLGPGGANNLGQYLSVAVPDQSTYPGADYYEIAVVEFEQQMHSNLSATRLRGYVQLSTSVVPGLQVPLTNPDGSLITLPNGTQAIGVDVARYLGPFVVAEKDRPVRVKFYNLLPTGAGGDLFLPVDTSVMGSGMGPIDMVGMPGMKESYTQNRATLHLHGGRSPWISDGTAHQWITPAGENTVYPKGVSVYNVPDMPDPGPGAMTFFYTNQQSARLMFYHDHAYGITRLNVYAGEAAGYVLRDAVENQLIAAGIIPADEIPLVIQDKTFVPDNTAPITNMWGDFASQLDFQDPTWNVNMWGGPGNLWYPHVYMTMQNPGDPSGMNTFGRWHYGPWFWPPTVVQQGPTENPYYIAPGTAMEPRYIPGVPTISSPGEAFMDTPVLNGIAYPYLDVQPKAYRFRILNAADDRFWNLQLYKATTGIVSSIYVTNGGSGYTTIPEVTLLGTTGRGATAKATIDPATGAVTTIDILTVGSGYTTIPTVIIGPPGVGGAQASATATIYTAPTEVGMVPAIFNATYPEGWPIDGRDGGIPDPANIGPSFIQIGNEGGFLPAPYVIPTLPVDWNMDQGTFDFGLVNQYTLQLGTAERADVIVDFSQFAGQTLILYNDSPAPSPAADPRLDYYTGKPDQTDSGGAQSILPGYGSNTRTLMQIRVANTTAAAPYDVPTLETTFAATATTEGVFAASQDYDTIVPQAAYSSAYNTTFTDVYSNIFDTSLSFTPIGSTTPLTIAFQPKTIQDEMGEAFDPVYGRMAVLMGVELPKTQAMMQTMILYNYPDPPTEIVKTSIQGTQLGTLGDGTQIWKITHNGVDVHTVHWHMFEVQLINRVAWDNNIRIPDPNELGWKETIRVNPLQDTIVALRPIIPDVPFDVPNSVRAIDPTMPLGVTLKTANIFDVTGEPIILTNHLVNYGWEYVWHCHILAHEEMDMMRAVAVAVPPRTPQNLVAMKQGSTATLLWTDSSLSETGFTLQRASDAGFTTGLVNFVVGANVTTYTDTTIKNNQNYYYRIQANNLVGDTTVYPAPASGFPTMQADSAWSNTAMVGTGQPPAAPSNLRATTVTANNVAIAWNDNSANEGGFLIQRALNNGFSQGTVNFLVGANTATFIDTTVVSNTRYYYRVLAFSGTGNSAWSNILSVRTL